MVWHVLEEGSTVSKLYVFGQELHAVSLFNSHTLCVAYIQTFTHMLFIDHGKEGLLIQCHASWNIEVLKICGILSMITNFSTDT